MRFQKGQSGNPHGRPKRGQTMADALRAALLTKGPDGKTNRQLVAEKLLALALEGNVSAIKEIYDRLDGKAPQPLEHAGADGGKVVIFEVRGFGGDP